MLSPINDLPLLVVVSSTSYGSTTVIGVVTDRENGMSLVEEYYDCYIKQDARDFNDVRDSGIDCNFRLYYDKESNFDLISFLEFNVNTL